MPRCGAAGWGSEVKLGWSLGHVARRGGRCPVWAPTGSGGAARRLRCGARVPRAAAMPLAAALNAPLLHGFSPVRPLRVPTARPACRAGSPGEQESAGTLARPGSPPCAAPLLAAPQVAHPGHRPPRSTTEVFVDASHGVAGKAVVGCAPAATSAAPRTADRMAARAQRALQPLTRVDCSSATNEVSEASFDAGHAIEDRRGAGRRPAAAAERRCMPGRGFARPSPSSFHVSQDTQDTQDAMRH
jgi:hypothetical protein